MVGDPLKIFFIDALDSVLITVMARHLAVEFGKAF